ncbi:MAG: cbb3-type cytochrome c oxidase subunit I [Ginsengibacter sp.]
MHLTPVELKKQRRLATTWSITFLILFPLLIALGLLLRLSQSELMKLLLANSYAFLTLHGWGMTGVLFSVTFASIWFLISTRFARLNINVGYFVYFTILMGVTGLTIATLIGKFGPGWYMLYPLPFKDPTWVPWSIRMATVSILVLSTGWLIGIIHVLSALAKEYGGFTNLLGWQYLVNQKSRKELPPIILITTVSLTVGLISIITGIILMFIYLFQSYETVLIFDPLLLKNMSFFFGRTLSSVTLYCAAGWMYALLPEFTGREWKTNKTLVYAWNATFFLILFSYLHHLYIHFAQLSSMQYAQITSHLSAIPATAITMFGVIMQLYHSKTKWSIVPLMILLGMGGWAIGSIAEAVDSTIVFNKALNNTLWIPAHDHTYTLMGIVLFILAFLFYLFSEKSNEKDRVAKTGFWIFVIGGYGFLLMLYLGGLSSIPQSYARYAGMRIESMHKKAVFLSQISVWFIILLLIGLFIMFFSLFAKILKKENPEL